MNNFIKKIISIIMVFVLIFAFSISTFAATKHVSQYQYGGNVKNYTATFSNPTWVYKTDYVTINNYSNRKLYCVIGGVGKYVPANSSMDWRFRTTRSSKTVSIKVQAAGGTGTYKYRIATSSGSIYS